MMKPANPLHGDTTPLPPLVSILIPAHNAEDWIADTISSALAQTWPNKEIIVVDDGSTDQTLSAARRFASEGVSVVTQKHQGASAARNKAFSLCQGDYIQWLDADDLLSPDKIAKQMGVAEHRRNKRTLISSSWAYFMHRPNKARFTPTLLWCDLTPVEWLLRKWEHNVHMQTATWLVSRELTEEASPWDARLLVDDDGEYFFRVIMKSEGIRFVPDAKVYYRAVASSTLSDIGFSNQKMEALFLGMKMQIGYLRSMEDNERVRAACLNYLQTWLGHFYPERPDLVEQARQLAAELGGELETPRLRWKYRWMQPIGGYAFAKRAQVLLPRVRQRVEAVRDKALFSLRGRRNSLSRSRHGRD
jgi:glycosyltransferase involved in cell wall biosynthesis